MEEGVVAFLDALGVKGIWAKAEPEQMINSWERVLQSFNESIETGKKLAGDVFSSINIKVFSDTVILTLKGDDPARLIPLMAQVLSVPFIDALLEGIYFRGVITVGKFYQSETLMIGPAIDEAAEWYTQPNWIGISATPTASFGIERLVDQGADISKWFIKYEIPTKNGKESGWALKWPQHLPTGILEKEHNISSRTLILRSFASRSIGIAEAPKYNNTVLFFDHVQKLRKTNK